MPKNTVNANFNQIAVADASDNVLGIRAAVGNVQITGGTAGQVISTNGSGVLSWATPPASLTYGSVTITAAVTIASPTSPGTTITTFTIPSAGTWLVSYSVCVGMTAGFPECEAILGVYIDSPVSFVAASSSRIQVNSTTNGSRTQLAQQFIVTTTASTIFRLSGYSPTTVNQQTALANNGTVSTSNVIWMKIA